ncbi:MAG: DUF3883 domain-containing protein [Deltaproteobacteria bacterium]|nr:DUF3883 domain-containing protein [Deltaproteobacteria bacterium]
MKISVGILYSTHDFLHVLAGSTVEESRLSGLNERFRFADIADIVKMCEICKWMLPNEGGVCVLTERGCQIVSVGLNRDTLRLQLVDIIDNYQPTWATKIPAGRKEALASFSSDIAQIFKEADLLEGVEESVVNWWDTAATKLRNIRYEKNLEVGRKAEKRSMKFEEERTGQLPEWQAIESNYSGYDIKSKVGETDRTPLLIEVKGSSLKYKEAYFTVTRNEWSVAEKSAAYCFHLWILNENETLLQVSKSDLEPHIPNDNSSGRWEQVRVPFRVFPYPLTVGQDPRAISEL